MNRSRMIIFLVAGLGILLCAVILLTGPAPIAANPDASKPEVTVGDIVRESGPRRVQAFGVLAPRQTLSLTSQVSGEVVWVNDALVPGGTLAAGDSAFRIDDRDYAIALSSAKARHAQSQANIDLEAGRAEIARLEWDAWQASEVDSVSLGAERSGGPSGLALREPQRAEAVAEQQAASAALAAAGLALERTDVRVPWAASVIDADAVQGQLLAAGEAIALLYPLDYAIVELQVPPSTLDAIDRGVSRVLLQPVDQPASGGDHVVEGKVDSVVRALTEDTRLATVRVRVDRPLDLQGWAFGMHLQAELVLQEEQDWALVPADLIVSGNLVWVSRQGKAFQQQIYPQQQVGAEVRVTDNFAVGDVLILERPIGLFDGAEVTPRERRTATGDGALADER